MQAADLSDLMTLSRWYEELRFPACKRYFLVPGLAIGWDVARLWSAA